MKSILQDNKTCFLCGKGSNLQVHHVFNGTAYRSKSDEDGMTLYLCPNCHYSVHNNDIKTLHILKKYGQKKWEAVYGSREDFIKRYGKNYL